MRQAEGQGMYEVLSKQAEGLKAIVDAAGGDAREAVLMLIADKLPELVKTQVEAIKNLKIDKVTVWEGGSGGANGQNGVGSTANFVSGLYKAVPPLKDLFDMAGMNLPSYLGSAEDVHGTVVSDSKPGSADAASKAATKNGSTAKPDKSTPPPIE
jgi:flotillin